MSQRIKGALRNALYKWTYTLLYFTLYTPICYNILTEDYIKLDNV